MNKFDTLFLDRDGVINRKIENNYVLSFSDFIFIPGSLIAISKLTSIFKRILIITNQQCIGKGLITVHELDRIHKKMIIEIENNGGKIDKIYFCPCLASENCECRKPKPGMIEKALQDFPMINIDNSYLVGDSKTDIEAGESQGLNTIKVDNEYTLFSWCSDLIDLK